VKQAGATRLTRAIYGAIVAAVITMAVCAMGAAGEQDSEEEPLAEIIVRGIVAEVIKSDKVIRLNLGAPQPHHRFAALIYPEFFGVFSNLDQLAGKTVQLMGTVTEIGGRPQIILKEPRQLAVWRNPRAASLAPKLAGEKAVVRGIVAEVARSDNLVRLNLGAKAPDHRAAAIVYPEHFESFPDLDKLLGKPVEISGELLDMPDRKTVLLTNKQQIAMLRPELALPADAVEPPRTTGERKTVRGLVAEVLKSDRVIRINLGEKAPNHRYSAVIYPKHFDAFDGVESWEGRIVEIEGEVAEVGGRPQIVLVATNQVAFLDLKRKTVSKTK
jgi:hypothetical protein